MKGLLLKDLYMMKRYCKSYLLVAIVFLAVSITGKGGLFFMFYPCLLFGMIPGTLLGYDERSHFLQYSAALPYTKTQIVSSKYLLGLITQVAAVLIIGAAQGIKMSLEGTLIWHDFAIIMLTLLIVSTLASSFLLPFLFRFGAEKGRIAYYVMIGLICAFGVLFSELYKGDFQNSIPTGMLFTVIAAAGVCIYVFSWYLSVVFYKRREL